MKKFGVGVFIFVILALSIIGFVNLASNVVEEENVDIIKGSSDLVEEGERSVDVLRGVHEEFAMLGLQKKYEEAYEYLSPQSKQKISKEDYIAKRKEFEESLLLENAKIKYQVHKIIVKERLGYVERSMKKCVEEKCNVEDRRYLKFTKINDRWLLELDNDDKYCIRTKLYDMPAEFERALSLITQRSERLEDVPSNPKNIKNCLKIEYAESEWEIGGALGAFDFVPSNETLGRYNIIVSPQFESKDDLLTAILLVHEITHVNQYLDRGLDNTAEECYLSEAQAFLSEFVFVLHALNEEERSSLIARAKNDTFSDSGLLMQLLIDILWGEEPVGEISEEDIEKIQNRALNFIKEDPGYQEQCDWYDSEM